MYMYTYTSIYNNVCVYIQLRQEQVWAAGGPTVRAVCAGILTSKVRARETYLRPYKVNPQAVLSAVYAWKCKTPTVLHFSKLIFNGRVCELYSPGSGRICYPSVYQI